MHTSEIDQIHWLLHELHLVMVAELIDGPLPYYQLRDAYERAPVYAKLGTNFDLSHFLGVCDDIWFDGRFASLMDHPIRVDWNRITKSLL